MAEESRTGSQPQAGRPPARPAQAPGTRRPAPPFRLRLTPPDADHAPAFVGDPIMGWESEPEGDEREHER